MMHSTRLLANVALLAVSALTLAAGLWARYLGADVLAWQLWLIGVVPNWLTLVVTIVRSLMRRQAGVDVLAVISISFALLSGEVLVAAVIALMLATGRTLG
jgi:cation transport ATPase